MNELESAGSQSDEAPSASPTSMDQQHQELVLQLKGTRRNFMAIVSMIFLILVVDVGVRIYQYQHRKLKLEFLATKQFCVFGQDNHVRISSSEDEDGKISLRLHDKKGQIRTEFSILADGSPILAMRNQESAVQSLMMVDEHGAHWTMFDSRGHRRLQIDASNDADMTGHFPGLRLFDGHGKTRMNLKLVTVPSKNGKAESSYSTLQFRDAKGKLRSSILLDQEGRPALDVVDEARRSVATMYVEKHNGNSFVYILGKDGEVLWEAK